MRLLILLLAAIPALFAADELPNVKVTDHTGRSYFFQKDLVEGKIVVINFFYSECKNLCPMMTTNIKRVNQLLAERNVNDIHFYSISLDPEKDTVEKLAEYHQLRSLPANWKLLRASWADMEELRHAIGFFDRDPAIDADRAQHSGMLRIGNAPMGRWIATSATGKPAMITNRILTVLPYSRTNSIPAAE